MHGHFRCQPGLLDGVLLPQKSSVFERLASTLSTLRRAEEELLPGLTELRPAAPNSRGGPQETTATHTAGKMGSHGLVAQESRRLLLASLDAVAPWGSFVAQHSRVRTLFTNGVANATTGVEGAPDAKGACLAQDLLDAAMPMHLLDEGMPVETLEVGELVEVREPNPWTGRPQVKQAWAPARGGRVDAKRITGIYDHMTGRGQGISAREYQVERPRRKFTGSRRLRFLALVLRFWWSR